MNREPRRRSTDRWLERLGELSEIGTPDRSNIGPDAVEDDNASRWVNDNSRYIYNSPERPGSVERRDQRSPPQWFRQNTTPVREEARSRRERHHNQLHARLDEPGQFTPVRDNRNRVEINVNRSHRTMIRSDNHSCDRNFDRNREHDRHFRFHSTPPAAETKNIQSCRYRSLMDALS